MSRLSEIGPVARLGEQESYPPVRNAAIRLAMGAERSELEFCCSDAEAEDVAWFSWYPWRLVCETHAMASQLPYATAEVGVFCDGCGRGPLNETIDRVHVRLTNWLVLVAALCERCPRPPS